MSSKPPDCQECPLWQVCVGQAELCREHARDAFECQRFEAARGLYLTASKLYERALSLNSGLQTLETRNRLRELDASRRRCEAAQAIRASS